MPQTARKAILKSASGIVGFDSITGGGLPRARTSLVLGEAGSGKTTFALQFLVNGAVSCHEPGIFVAFEEKSAQVIENASSFDWNIRKLSPEQLFFLDARLNSDTLVSGNFDLNALLASLDVNVKKLAAKRVVFDSVDILLGLLSGRNQQQAELYRIREWISDQGLTGLLTGKQAYGSMNQCIGLEMLPYVADSVIILNHDVNENHSRRSIRVLKYRGSSFKERELPFVIDSSGIEVIHIDDTSELNELPVSTKRLPTGVERLDHMIGGGYFKGSSVLITGAPGTMKSTLAGSFINANCKAKRKAVYLSFDELSKETIRNFRSVGIDLKVHVESGHLIMIAERTTVSSPEQVLVRLQKVIRSFQPDCLVIDPVSALVRAANRPSSATLAEQAIQMAKSLGITVLCTSLIEGGKADHEASPVQISSIADTWIHVSYLSKAGERNRALTIIKSRGTAHSNQIRELLVDNSVNLTLSDIYTSDGEVLMGTLRWQKEEADRIQEEKLESELAVHRAELQLAETVLDAKIASYQKELEIKRLKLAELLSSAEGRRAASKEYKIGISALRGTEATKKQNLK